MVEREYNWESAENPPIIGRHSLNKHEVLVGYLERYLDKLYSGARDYMRVSLVDGFAGGGVYRLPETGKFHFGSPVQIMNVVREAQTSLPAKYGKFTKIKPRYYFVDKNPHSLSVLRGVLSQLDLDPVVDGKGGILSGAFEDQLGHILQDIQSEGRTHKALFVLDQYAYGEVPKLTIQRIFKELPQAEIILTFAVDRLIEDLSAKPGHLERCQQRMEGLGIGLSLQDLVALKEDAPHSRLLIQDLLSEELSRNCGARFFTRYFIQSGSGAEGNHRNIWLVHMSQHEVARDEMTRVHWEAASHISKHSGFSGIDDYGLHSLGYTTALDDTLGELNLEYGFDPNSERASIDVLLKQLPRIIWHDHTLTFGELMGKIANHTPVSSVVVKKVLDVILGSKDIEITALDGTKRRKGNAVEWKDIIKARRQSLFDYQT